MYAVHLSDKATFSQYSAQYNVKFLSDLFHLIDNYSPFNELLESDEELIAKLKRQSGDDSSPGHTGDDSTPSQTPDGQEPVFTVEQLRQYDGSTGSPGLYIALLGVVYDVSKGAQYYGPGGGYSFFAGRDASRAYVTGKFEEEGLVSNVDG